MNFQCTYCNKECVWSQGDVYYFCSNHSNKVKFIMPNSNSKLEYIILDCVYNSKECFAHIYQNNKVEVFQNFKKFEFNCSTLTPENINNKLSILLCFS